LYVLELDKIKMIGMRLPWRSVSFQQNILCPEKPKRRGKKPQSTRDKLRPLVRVRTGERARAGHRRVKRRGAERMHRKGRRRAGQGAGMAQTDIMGCSFVSASVFLRLPSFAPQLRPEKAASRA